jgi:hypothetical protein
MEFEVKDATWMARPSVELILRDEDGTHHGVLIEQLRGALPDVGMPWWIARDSMDRGDQALTLVYAVTSFALASKKANSGTPGHAKWMAEIAMPWVLRHAPEIAAAAREVLQVTA